MADKTQNITINYKFNTSDIDRADASLKKANEASNALQAAGAKAGKAIGTGFSQGTKSILSMQNSLVRLKTQIDVSTNPASTAKLSAEYKKLKTELDAATKSAFSLANAQKQAGASAQGLTSQMGGLFGAVRAVVTAGLVREAANIAINLAKLAGNVEGVERAFKRAFPNSVATLNALREATKGTITDFELMQRTLQATNLGVAVEQLPQLFEFAAARAQQTGESVDYLVDSIVRGIGRKSPLILDNLGISAIRLKEKFGGAALAAQSVGDVTKAVAEIAEEELAKIGGFAETSATKVAQLAVAWESFRVAVAKKLEPGTSGFVSFLKESLDLMRLGVTSNKELFLESTRQIGSADALRVIQSKEFKEFGDNQQKKFDFIQQEINSRIQLIGRYNDNLNALKDERKLLEDKNPYDKKIDNLTRQIKGYNENKVVIASTILALKEYLKALDLTNKGEEASIISIKTLRDQLKELQTQREEATSIGDTRELDRLQREIMLLDDRILKISDNIKWQKQWDFSKEQSKLAEMNLAEETKLLTEIIEGLTNKYVELSNAAPSVMDSMEDIEGSVKELAESIELTTGKEFLIRLRLGFQGKGGEASEIQALINGQLKELGKVVERGITDNLHSIVDAEVDSYKARLNALGDFYNEQMLLAGDNERAKDQLRIRELRETKKLRDEIARKEKQAAKTHILIDIAVGVAKAIATYIWPYWLIPAAAAAAQGAAQLAIVNRAPANFAKGVIGIKGPGSETSDSIPVNVSRNESIMTGWETRYAGDVLRDIRAKKLDNNKLRELKHGRSPAQSQAFNDERIIKAIKEQKHPDVVKASNLVYESKKYTEDYKKRVRSSSMGI